MLDEFEPAKDACQRVVVDVTARASVVADPILVKMLLRNLIQNALQHTAGGVRVWLASGRIEISDQGKGLPESYRRLLVERTMPAAEMAALPGFGLFIVTLVCERLGWQLAVPRNSAQGTRLHLRFGQ